MTSPSGAWKVVVRNWGWLAQERFTLIRLALGHNEIWLSMRCWWTARRRGLGTAVVRGGLPEPSYRWFCRRMIECTEDCLGLRPERLAADRPTAAEMLGWLVNERAIEPHIPVFDKSARDDGTFSRGDFNYNQDADFYACPAGKVLPSTGTLVNDGTLLYRASKHDATPASLSGVVVRRCPPARSRVQFTRTPETLRATLPRPRPRRRRGANVRRSRCFELH